ncbi:MAG: hypothetical protein AAGJ50_12765, partial [Pseudomonadota bacterium]
DAEGGCAFENGDAKGLADYIRYLSRDRQESERVGAAGRSHMQAHFTPQMRSEDGKTLLRILSPADKAGQLEWYDVSLEPHAELVSSAHAAGTTEHFTSIDGRFEIVSGDARSIVESGGTARYPADRAHTIRNLSEALSRGILVVEYR